MALLSEKIQAMRAAQDAHVRQFNDPSFHFVPRQKMMQIQVRPYIRVSVTTTLHRLRKYCTCMSKYGNLFFERSELPPPFPAAGGKGVCSLDQRDKFQTE